MDQDINRVEILENDIQARQIQVQQIANMMYSSHQHIAPIPSHRTSLTQPNYGSTPHIPQTHSPQQQIHHNNMRPAGRIIGNIYLLWHFPFEGILKFGNIIKWPNCL